MSEHSDVARDGAYPGPQGHGSRANLPAQPGYPFAGIPYTRLPHYSRNPWWLTALVCSGAGVFVVGTAIAAIVFLLSSLNDGRRHTIVEQPVVDEPIPAYDQWVPYEDGGNNFAAHFPRRPSVSTTEIETSIGKRVLHRARMVSDPTTFEIGYYDIEWGTGGYTITFIDGLLVYARSLNAIVLDAYAFVVQHHEGVKAELLMPGGRRAFVAHIHAERHYYMLQVVNAPPELKDDFDFFVQSFTLSDTALRIAPLTISGPRICTGWADAEFTFPWQNPIKIEGGRKPYTFTIDPPLPEGLTAYGSRGPATTDQERESYGTIHVRGVPSDAGVVPFTVSVTDKDGRTASFEAAFELEPLPPTLGDLTVRYSSASRVPENIPPDFHFRLTPFKKWALTLFHVSTAPRIPIDYEWSCDGHNLPKGMTYSASTHEFRFGGSPAITGSWEIPVSCIAKVKGSERVEERSVTLTIEMLPLESDILPESPGSIEVFNSRLEGSHVWAQVRFSPVKQPYRTTEDWPAEFVWSWNQADVPDGMTISEAHSELRVAASHAAPGTYEITFSCTVQLQYVEKPYEITRTLTFKVTE